MTWNKANLDSCDRPSNLTQVGFKSLIFRPVLCDLEIIWMTLKNNRPPLLYYIKLCASFQSHRWIKTGVSIRKRPIWVIIGGLFVVPCDRLSNLTQIGFISLIFRPVWSWNLKNDLVKNKGTSSMLFQAMCIISKQSGNPNWSYVPVKPKLGQNLLWTLWPWPLTSDLDLLHAHQSVHGYNSCTFHNDTMTET